MSTETRNDAEDPQWYFVHTYSGQEERVRRNLEQRVETLDVKHLVHDIVVPTEEVEEFKGGKRVRKRERLFQGYMLVNMIMDDYAWSVVRNTPGVTGFVSADDEREQKARPVPLEEHEVLNIMERIKETSPKKKVGLDKGQAVRITDGPFADFLGTVDEIDQDKGRLRVLVSFFGRDTPVELDLLQVEKQ
jgi:transcriptional antiterminator NusG